MNSAKTISIQYYAVFREQRGLSSESRVTDARTLRELYAELKSAHGFSLPLEQVQVAVGDEFADWDEDIVENCAVVFIPPVAGG